MANKRQVQHELHTVQRVKTWQLVLLFLLSLVVSATFLRLNDVGMKERRTAVLAADEEGTIHDVRNRLVDLQRYVSQHMFTSTGRIWLVEQYEKEVERRKRAAEEQLQNQNSNDIQKKVVNECDARARVNGWYYPSPQYVQCVTEGLAQYPSAPNPLENIELPDRNQYRHEYISPAWTPDFAGFSVLVSVLLALAILVRITVAGILRLLLRRHFKAT